MVPFKNTQRSSPEAPNSDRLEALYETILENEDDFRDQFLSTIENMQYQQLRAGDNERLKTVITLLKDNLLHHGPFESKAELNYCLEKYADKHGYIITDQAEEKFNERLNRLIADLTN